MFVEPAAVRVGVEPSAWAIDRSVVSQVSSPRVGWRGKQPMMIRMGVSAADRAQYAAIQFEKERRAADVFAACTATIAVVRRVVRHGLRSCPLGHCGTWRTRRRILRASNRRENKDDRHSRRA